jgi:hypothetical protein
MTSVKSFGPNIRVTPVSSRTGTEHAAGSVEQYEAAFVEMLDLAFSPDDTLELLATVASEL